MAKSNTGETAEILRRIDVRIKELGMSKVDFYKKSGISSASYSQWKTGQHVPTDKKLAQAARVLDVSVHYLMTGENKKIPTTPEGDGYSEEELMWLEWLRARATPQQKAIIRLMFEEAE